MSGFFDTAMAHLDAEAERMRVVLRHHLAIERAIGRLPKTLDPLERGFVSPHSVDLGLDPKTRHEALQEEPTVRDLGRERERVEQEIAQKLARAAAVGVHLPLPELIRRAALSPLARELLMLAVLAELDGGIRRALGFIQNDITRQHLDLELACELFTTLVVDRGQARGELAPSAPLVRLRLLALPDYILRDDVSLLRMPLRPSRRVVDHLAGRADLDPLLVTVARRTPPPGTPPPRPPIGVPSFANTLVLGRDARVQVDRALQRFVAAKAEAPVLTLCGPEGVGKTALARAVAASLGLALLEVRAPALPDEPDAIARACRESVLSEALLLLSEVDRLSDDRRRALVASLDEEQVPVVLEGRASFGVPTMRPRFALELVLPDHAERTLLWEALLARAGLPNDDAGLFAVKYRVGGGVVMEALDRLRVELGTSTPSAAELSRRIETALAERRVHGLRELARPIRSRPTWAEVVLAPATHKELTALVRTYRHRKRVLVDWGLDRILATGQGLSALFEGPPGTGKTFAAGLIARELDMELFQVDVSRIVSKWIGETEKNLATIFDEAEKAHAILLFDEADSLFGKRTEVKSSNDRSANLEVNFLLQKMDAYPGITILTSNLGSSIDEAFARRLTARVSFPAPEKDEREKLWRALVPTTLAIAGDVDFAELGERFDLSGGHIRNAVLRAAVLAADAGTAVSMAHLVEAARAEYRALGRLIRE